MTSPLPEFEKPPVVEVALSVQFEKLEALRVPQLGLVWQAFRDRFPKTEEQPPLDPTFEQFGLGPGGRPGVRLELMTALPTPRLWFLNAAETELVQVQPDRFVRNWRKKEESDAYPRYVRLRKSFREDFETFRQLVEQQQWGRVEPNQCEATYVNLIPAGEGWSDHGDLDKVITIFAARYSDDHLAKLEEAAVEARFVLNDENGSPIGRLHVAANPVVRTSDNRPALRLTLTARGMPQGDGIDGAMRFLDRGREAIVRGFTSITTQTMHQIWKRIS